MTSAGAIKVAIAGQLTSLVADLEHLARIEGDVTIISTAATAPEAIAAIEASEPDVLLVDLEMAGVFDVVRRKTRRTNVMLLIAPQDKTQLANAIKLGCSALLQKGSATKAILEGIRAVNMGEVWLDPHIATELSHLASSQHYRVRRDNGVSGLSEREHQIVQLVSQGYKNSGIARQMGISEQTVKNHLHNIFNKIGVSDRLDLALYAVDKGWHLNHKAAPRAQTGSGPVVLPALETQG